MGKKSHRKDRQAQTASELQLYQSEVVGNKQGNNSKAVNLQTILPFGYCSLTLNPCSKLSIAELIQLKLDSRVNDSTGSLEYSDPVTLKPFTEYSHIVAIATSGRVYCYETIEEFCIKANSLVDLVEENIKFSRQDIIHLQDPSAKNRRVVGEYSYIKHSHSIDSGEKPITINSNLDQLTHKVFAALPKLEAKIDTKLTSTSAPAPNLLNSSSAAAPANALRSNFTSGAAAASITSTSFTPILDNAGVLLSEQQIREEKYDYIRKHKGSVEKSLMRIVTNCGNLNVEIHADLVPRIADSFLALCERGYYDNNESHRKINNFMIQFGKKGDTSLEKAAFAPTIADEFHPLLSHNRRGILSMANRGPNTNAAQFFISFRELPHLDSKHCVFGCVVGGLEVLDKFEDVATEAKTEKPLDSIRILHTIVYKNTVKAFDFESEKSKDKKGSNQSNNAAKPHDPESSVMGRNWFTSPSFFPQKKLDDGEEIGQFISAQATLNTQSKRKAEEAQIFPPAALKQFDYVNSNSAMNPLLKKVKSSNNNSSYGDFNDF